MGALYFDRQWALETAMKRRQALKYIPLGLTTLNSVVYAQQSNPLKEQNDLTVEQLFDIAAAKHKHELQDLELRRGTELPDLYYERTDATICSEFNQL